MNQAAIKILKERNKLDGLYLLADLIEIEKNNKEVCRGVQLIQSVIARSLLDTLGADSTKLQTIVAVPNAGVDYKDALVTMSGLDNPGKEVDLFILMLLKQAALDEDYFFLWKKNYPEIENTIKNIKEKESRNEIEKGQVERALRYLKGLIDEYYFVMRERYYLQKEYQEALDRGEQIPPPQLPELPRRLLLPHELFALTAMIEYVLYKNISIKVPKSLEEDIKTVLTDANAPGELKNLILKQKEGGNYDTGN